MEKDSIQENTLSASSSTERIKKFIDEILEHKGEYNLSQDAQKILSHIKKSEKDLGEIDKDELTEILLEGLQSL